MIDEKINCIDDPANLEQDLHNNAWIAEKIRSNSHYAQHVYAALCNNEFQKQTVVSLLRHDTWRCSWRHAGGIISQIQGKGDYIDWYCSGMEGGDPSSYETHSRGSVIGEGYVTDEVKADLRRLGWHVITDPND